MRPSTTHHHHQLLLALIVCSYSIDFIGCTERDVSQQSTAARDKSSRLRDSSAVDTSGRNRQPEEDTTRQNSYSGGADAAETHRTGRVPPSSAGGGRTRRESLGSHMKTKRSWDDSDMSWMKRLDVRKLSRGEHAAAADDDRLRAPAAVVGIRAIERVNPTGMDNKRSFDTDMAWLKRSTGNQPNLDRLHHDGDDQIIHQPDIRSWDESDMSWIKRSSAREAIKSDNDVASHQLGQSESADDKRKWKSDVSWIKK